MLELKKNPGVSLSTTSDPASDNNYSILDDTFQQIGELESEGVSADLMLLAQTESNSDRLTKNKRAVKVI